MNTFNTPYKKKHLFEHIYLYIITKHIENREDEQNRKGIKKTFIKDILLKILLQLQNCNL